LRITGYRGNNKFYVGKDFWDFKFCRNIEYNKANMPPTDFDPVFSLCLDPETGLCLVPAVYRGGAIDSADG
jgi:hypothetical protein